MSRRRYVFSRWYDPDDRPRVIGEVVDEIELECAYGPDVDAPTRAEAEQDPELLAAVLAWEAGDDTRNEAARVIGAAEGFTFDAWETPRLKRRRRR